MIDFAETFQASRFHQSPKHCPLSGLIIIQILDRLYTQQESPAKKKYIYIYIYMYRLFREILFTQTRANGYPFLLVQLEAPSAWRMSGESLSFVDNVAVSSSAFPPSCTFAVTDFTRERRKNGNRERRAKCVKRMQRSSCIGRRPVINLYLPTLRTLALSFPFSRPIGVVLDLKRETAGG